MNDTEIDDKQEEMVRRQRAFAEMNDATQAAAKKLESLFAHANRGEIIVMWEIGRLVGEIATREGIYGVDAVKLLADYLPVSQGIRTLLNYRLLASEFDREALEQAIAQPLANGKRLSLSHLIELSTVSSLKIRAALVNRVRAESLSVDDLRKEIRGNEYRSCTKRGGGRKQKPPVSVPAGLRDLATRADRVVGFAGVFGSVCDRVEEMPPNEVDEELLNRLESAESSAVNAMSSLEKILDRLGDAKARVKRVLAKKNKSTAVPAAV